MTNLKALRPLLVAFLLAGTGFVHAQGDKAALIQRIAQAQGLLELFDQQLVQQRDPTRAYAGKVFEDTVREAGGEPNTQEKQAFDKMITRVGELFSAKELVAAWVSVYGRDLSADDLTQILNYYLSPTGKKDVAASKAAMASFSVWLAEQGQQRSGEIITTFASELRAARP